MNQICRAVVLGLAAAVLAWAAAEAEPQNLNFEETMKRIEALDAEMYELQKLVPGEPLLDLMEKRIRRIAEETEELDTLEIKVVPGAERLRLADGTPAPIELHRLELSGRSPFSRVHLLLMRLQVGTSRMSELETLRLDPAEGDTVGFTARLAFPTYRAWDKEDLKAGSPDEMLRGMVRMKELTLKLLKDLEARSQPGRLVDALVVFGREMDGRAVGLTGLSWERGKAVMKGVVLGKSAGDGLRPALAKAGFLVQDVGLSPAGRCQAFTVTAGVKPAERSDEYDPANGLFEHRTAAFCDPLPPSGRVKARGTAPAGRSLDLHLRDYPVIDAFILLHELTSAGFLVDGDVQERISVDVEGATLEELLKAMGSAGLAVGPGPIHRVSRAGKPSQPAGKPADYSAEPMDMTTRNAVLTEALCALSRVAERKILGPPGLRGIAQMYADNVRADQVIEALVASAGLVSVVDGDRLLIAPGTAAEVRVRKDLVDVCEIRVPRGAGNSRLSSMTPDLGKLAAGDLELAGLVRQGETWTAYAFTPTRKLTALKVGERLSDGSVSAVGQAGVTLTTQSKGAVYLKLRP